MPFALHINNWGSTDLVSHMVHAALMGVSNTCAQSQE